MRAGVLMPVLPHPEEPQVVLTVRSFEVEHHKGEISFPGGAYEAEDADILSTALREAHEEVGIAPEHVEVLGEHSHYLTISDFHVTPFVGLLDRSPYPFRALEREVAEVLTVPLRHLLDPANLTHQEFQHEGRVVVMREYWWEGHRIWGATAAMLGGLLDDMQAALE